MESFKAPMKRMSFVAVIIWLFVLPNYAQAKENETKHLQVLITAADPSFRYVINDGTGLHYGNPFHPRPFGSSYILNGLIFPEGTIDVMQSNYTVDTQGTPLTAANSIGVWQCVGNVLVDLLKLPNVPPQPTIAEIVTWDFFFKTGEKGAPNNLYTTGAATSGVLAPNQALFKVINAVVGGTGPNDDIDGKLTAEIYFQSTSGSMLINVSFDENIKY